MRRALVCAFVALPLICVSTTDADVLRTVVLSGDSAPGTTGMYSGFSFYPVINELGQVAFTGFLGGSSVSTKNDSGVWSEGGGALALVAREGSSAPDTGAFFSNFNFASHQLGFDDAGRVSFSRLLSGPGVDGTNNAGIWSGGSSTLGLVARTGSAAPGTDAVFSQLQYEANLNDFGKTTFVGHLAGSTITTDNDTGVWSQGSGVLNLIAREGEPAPGTAANYSDLVAARLNSAGQTLFAGTLAGAEVNSGNDQGMWIEQGGSTSLVVRTGSAAPGTTADFSDFTGMAFNDAGQTAFLGTLTGAGVSVGQNNFGIWSQGSGTLAILARSGSPAPGTNKDFYSFFTPKINGAGNTAFVGFLSPSNNDYGLWSDAQGSLELVAREDDLAPGTSVNYWFLANPVLNGAGQLAFSGTLKGTGVDGTNNSAIWAQDRTGEVFLIAREGDELDVDDGPGVDSRTIKNVSFYDSTGNQDGRGTGFNDRGQLVFKAEFTDGTSGIFISNLVATLTTPGDFDEDGDVDGADLLMWQRGESPTPFSPADFADWQNHYGTSGSSPAVASQAVPEPTTFVAFLLALAVMSGSRVGARR